MINNKHNKVSYRVYWKVTSVWGETAEQRKGSGMGHQGRPH